MLAPISFSREAIKNGSKSFALASLLLPKKSRAGVYALYAWCRACDDLFDLGETAVGQAESAGGPDIAEVREWTHRDPTMRSLLLQNRLRASHFEIMLLGMQMDQNHLGYRTLGDLELYCFRVAGVVGLMMCALLGVDDEKAYDHAIALGIAMQLTNISRDTFEDATRGRVYMPLEDLGVKDLHAAVNLLRLHPEHAHGTAKKLLARADELYQHGRQGLGYLPFRAALAVGVAGRFYQIIGHRLLDLARDPAYDAFRKRTFISTFCKLKVLVAAVAEVVFTRWKPRAALPLIFPQWVRQETSGGDPSGL